MFERILTRNHDPVWIFYFALTASVALVGALGLAASDWLPSLSGGNLPLLFILMAYIFGFAFAYGLLGFLASRPFRSPVHRQLAGWSAVFVVAIGYPMGINMLVSHEAAQLRATDRPLARPLPDFRSIGFKDQYLFRHVAPDSREFMATLQCNEPCIRLLYNGAVDKVVVEVTAYETPLKTFTRTISYSLERHSECPAPNIASSTDWRWDRGPEGDTASDRVVRRIAGGECLIGVPVEQIDADLLLDTRSPTATPFFPHGYQTESLLWRKPALGSMRIRLTVGYGIAATALGASAWLLWRSGARLPARAPALASICLFAFWVFTQIRMAFHGADLVSEGAIGLGEAGVYVLLFGAVAAGCHAALNWFGTASIAGPLHTGFRAANGAALAAVVLLSLVVANPWFDQPLYGPIGIDSSMVGYLLPALMFAWLAWQLRHAPHGINARFLTVNRTAAIALAYVYLITLVRRAFAGVDRFTFALTTDGEQYAYSLVTLGFGVALLAAGFKLASRDVRLASAIFVTLAVAKVFLYDMAGLTGLWRAFSFIGLGGVLIGIGIFYQRLLFSKHTGK